MVNKDYQKNGAVGKETCLSTIYTTHSMSFLIRLIK